MANTHIKVYVVNQTSGDIRYTQTQTCDKFDPAAMKRFINCAIDGAASVLI